MHNLCRAILELFQLADQARDASQNVAHRPCRRLKFQRACRVAFLVLQVSKPQQEFSVLERQL